MTGGQKQVLANRNAFRVELWKGYFVCRAVHRPPGHGMFEAWLGQQDAIESDLHRIIAEDALRVISNRFEERFRASFPALPRGFALESIVLAQEGFGDMPYDLEGQHFPRDEIHTLGAVGPVRRLCSTRETVLRQSTTTVEQAAVIRDALSSKSAHCAFHAGKVRSLVLQHSFFLFQRCPEFLVGEVAPNECDWKQPGVTHGILPADLTHVSRHVSCVAPCLDTRLGNRRHDVIKFPAPKRASYLQASATVEASASIFPFAATVRWHVSRCRLCSTARLRGRAVVRLPGPCGQTRLACSRRARRVVPGGGPHVGEVSFCRTATARRFC